MTGTPVRFGVVGCGAAAGDVCEAIAVTAGAEVAAVYDVDADRARQFAARYRAPACDSLGQLLHDPAVEAVYVAVPHAQLPGTVSAAIGAGRHVLAEKPLALTAGAADQLGRAADAAGRQLGVCFVLRVTPAVRWARHAVAAGAIGSVRAVRIWTVIDKPASYWRSGAPAGAAVGWRGQRARAGGGVVLMNCVHLLDVVRVVTGLEFTTVTAQTAAFTPDVDVEDTAAAAMRLDNGAIVSLAAASGSPGAAGMGSERISIDGDAGRIDLPYLLGTEPARVFLRRAWADVPPGAWRAVDLPSADCYAATVGQFADCVRGRGEPPASAADAARAIGVVAAVYEAARTGTAVRLSP